MPRTRKTRKGGFFFCSQGVCTRKQPRRTRPFLPPPDRYQHMANQAVTPKPKRKKGIEIG